MLQVVANMLILSARTWSVRNDVINYDAISHISQIETRNFAEKREKTMEKSTTHHSQQHNLSFYRQLYQPRTCPLTIKEREESKNDQNKREMSCAELIKDTKVFMFYTGLTPEVFPTLFKNILLFTENLRYWLGANRGFAPFLKRGLLGTSQSDKHLHTQDQFPLWLVKCRLNSKTVDLAYRFSISSFTVSRIFTSWTKLWRPLFENFIIWPSKETYQRNSRDSHELGWWLIVLKFRYNILSLWKLRQKHIQIRRVEIPQSTSLA